MYQIKFLGALPPKPTTRIRREPPRTSLSQTKFHRRHWDITEDFI